jgi:YD repeat-containing protein
VTAQGSQTRSFAYDSLGRLTSATNPESNTTTYLYDASSNLTPQDRRPGRSDEL